MGAEEPQFLSKAKWFSGTPVLWDYFTSPEGPRRGIIRNLSAQELQLCSTEEVAERRWLRLVLRQPRTNMARVVRGRVIYQAPALDCWPDEQLTLFRQTIELMDALPEEWVMALIDDSLDTCACGSLIPMKKPAEAGGDATGVCGLCHLKSVMLTSRP